MPTVRLLGPVDVIDDNGVVHTPGSPLRCTLLALLALQPRTLVDTDALLDRIWDGQPPASGRRALRFHISRLRYEVAIADLIVTVGSAYRLDANTDLAGLTNGLAADTDADTLAALLATRWATSTCSRRSPRWWTSRCAPSTCMPHPPATGIWRRCGPTVAIT